ncbi:putative protein OS=Tsukamurella paurometabola (strain ATCC 8368 / DSM / CCUG 35730 /CIP 100753 / JCM 10117 / KCTC 9821 / NBRC 16120 / NCIMB 702349/ NCTC 13040) OX=521096 GN=Tpau_0441 PE=4 SV=1 [Tsukamurella paurometabola]|uniref:Uncharacterized protein n=1 Tax=Tsukamurella paurometabola (strain ATCC 8368 / DSM 20162 / CCUG 35730 / CIP 100753 / JCM 10117 / KCTC 9821 / NBRC 16120 / NCIMB 702349 / NCTC 13040) TaxID=521096 RepID=D5URM9_TSUPD|nr:hypothetical protein [Tsukamurella paurometabola]ADG77082.1 hypothetical protein Tpau_0441 [Tsukamurella paurometabola DSM 20162]SUP42712.1 Uncharacterised protein [Tsukamurella paurometabola]
MTQWQPIQRSEQERVTPEQGGPAITSSNVKVLVMLKPLPDGGWSSIFYEESKRHQLAIRRFAEWEDKVGYHLDTDREHMSPDIARFDRVVEATNERYQAEVLPGVRREAAAEQRAQDRVAAIEAELASIPIPGAKQLRATRPEASGAKQAPPRRRRRFGIF